MSYQVIGTSKCNFSSICGNEAEQFWLAPMDKGPIVYWEEGRKWKELDFPLGYIPHVNSFADIVLFDGFVWMVPQEAEGVWRIDCEKNQLYLYDKIPLEANKMHVCCSDDNLFFFSQKVNQLYIIDKKDKSLNVCNVFLPDERIEYHINNRYELKTYSEFYQNEEYCNKFPVMEGKKQFDLNYYFYWLNCQSESKKEKREDLRTIAQEIIASVIEE